MVASLAKNGRFAIVFVLALLNPATSAGYSDPNCETACASRPGLSLAGGGDLSVSVSGSGATPAAAKAECDTNLAAAKEKAEKDIVKCDSAIAKDNKAKCQKRPGPNYFTDTEPPVEKRATCGYRCTEGTASGGTCGAVAAAVVIPSGSGPAQPVPQLPPNFHAGRMSASQTLEQCFCVGG